MRFPASWRASLDAHRCLIVSPFTKTHRRVTAELAEERNSFVAGLAKEVVVLHAHPGGRIDRQFRELISNGSSVWTLDLPENSAIIQAGARPATLDALGRILH
jgi:hypothetical protein